MLDPLLNATETKVLIEGCGDFQSLFKSHFVSDKTESLDSIGIHDTAYVGRNVGVWMFLQKFANLDFAKNKAAWLVS